MAEIVLLLNRENRRQLRRERIFQDQLDFLAIPDDLLLRYYRFTRSVILLVINLMTPFLKRETRRSHALPVHIQVLCALRFFASGSFQSVVGDVAHISQASASRIVRDFTTAFCQLANRFIKFPNTQDEITEVKRGFYQDAQFPKVIGAIDCTHIHIKAPPEEENIYVNRKGVHTLNCQGICDHKMKFINFVARWPGSTHDAYIWRNSNVKQFLDSGHIADSWLIGDSGYPLQPYLMTPIPNPRTPAEVRYNRSLTTTRNKIERCFGRLKSCFRCLDKSGGSLQYSTSKCCKIIITAVILHNIGITHEVPFTDDLILEVDDNPVVRHEEDNPRGVQIRNELVNMCFG